MDHSLEMMFPIFSSFIMQRKWLLALVEYHEKDEGEIEWGGGKYMYLNALKKLTTNKFEWEEFKEKSKGDVFIVTEGTGTEDVQFIFMSRDAEGMQRRTLPPYPP